MADPQWDGFLDDIPQGGPKCSLPAHEDCTPLDVESTARHLEPGGTLGTMEGYEARPGQLDMLRAVVRAFNGRSHLMVEAGTGVGKSLAYLVPAVQWSVLNDTPVVISTATRNLQSQLTGTDLPRAAETLGQDAAKLRWTVLKGRGNYLCLRALEEYMQGGWWTLADDEKSEFSRFLEWLYRTKDGDLDGFGGEELRARLVCPAEDCMGRTCRYASKCFVAKARNRAMHAHVIVANHALAIAEAASPVSSILPAYGRIVFDEAHNLEDVATDQFSFELSRPALARLLGRLARQGRGQRGGTRTRGLLGTVERCLSKGMFGEASEEIRELANRAHVQSGFVTAAADGLFSVLGSLFAPAPKADLLRYRTLPAQFQKPGGQNAVRQYCLQGMFADYTAAQWDESLLAGAVCGFEDSFAKLQGIVQRLGETLASCDGPDGETLCKDLAVQAFSLAMQFTEFMLDAKCVLDGSAPDRVFWIERIAPEDGAPARKRKRKSAANIRLVGAPISVAEEMKRCFYDRKDSVVLCSATLRTGGRFDYMARKLGLDLVAAQPPECGEEAPSAPRVQALVAASPFDYFRQTYVAAADFLPDPVENPEAYSAEMADFLVRLIAATRGRALVLFTAYDMMRTVAELARPGLEESGIELLVQGEGLSREQMVRRLKDAGEGMALFGAQSFWEGVDVPGPALSCVVIARLPFPQIGEPVSEARQERIVEQGGSGFRDFMLPEAVIRFRQGFGRLVRAKSDRGAVVIADPRIVRKNYGAVFRKAIEASVRTVSSMDEAVAGTAAFVDAGVDGRTQKG